VLIGAYATTSRQRDRLLETPNQNEQADNLPATLTFADSGTNQSVCEGATLSVAITTPQVLVTS
jgi:hypothetical protein